MTPGYGFAYFRWRSDAPPGREAFKDELRHGSQCSGCHFERAMWHMEFASRQPKAKP